MSTTSLRLTITKLILVCTIITFMLNTGCHKLCAPKQFSFSGGVASVVPVKDSIHVGDTLWFNTSLPINFKYWGGGSDSTAYNLSGASNVTTDIHLTSLVGRDIAAYAADSFSFLPATEGSFKPNPLATQFAKTITYAQKNNSFNFSFAIVANRRGVYCLTILDIYQAMKRCDKVSVAITMNNIDSHLHYLKDIYYGGGSIDAIDSTHTYCFKVY